VFDLSIEKLFILAVVAMFVLGPERLPAAAAWLARTLRQIKTYANDANQKLRSELGPEFDEIRTPLHDLRSDLTGLRAWRDPRAALLHHLCDDPTTPHHDPPPPAGDWDPTPQRQPVNPPPRPLAAGERPPIDTDAT
jgi:sec-independent protein translocase protein TatB